MDLRDSDPGISRCSPAHAVALALVVMTVAFSATRSSGPVHIEDQLAASAIEGHESHSVEKDHVAGLDEHARQVGGTPKDDTPTMTSSPDAERNASCVLASADRTGEEHVFTARDLDPYLRAFEERARTDVLDICRELVRRYTAK